MAAWLFSEWRDEGKNTLPFTIVSVPLAFVRSGIVNMDAGQLLHLGRYAFARSNTTFSSQRAYILNANEDDIFSNTSHDPRYHGFPLRYN